MDTRMEQEDQPGKDDKDKPSGLMEKIQQLGQTNVPQLSQDSNIHCLTIVGQYAIWRTRGQRSFIRERLKSP